MSARMRPDTTEGDCMKRDMDLVREILLAVEGSDDIVNIEQFVNEERSLDFVGYHVKMMEDAGLVYASVQDADDGVYCGMITNLTWEGQDYLASIKDDGVWTKTRKVIKETVGSTTLSLTKSIALKIAEQAIRDELGIG
jgi:hypothetical protein